MLGLTAVATKEKDNDRHDSPETGVFVTHSPRKTFSRNTRNCINMYFNHYTTTLLTVCYILLTISASTTAKIPEAAAEGAVEAASTFPISRRGSDLYKIPPAPYECGSMDFRNNCNDFHRLKNCTVITGFLDITYISRMARCNYSEYVFENLTEITDFLLLHLVENLTSVRTLFPNLVVIRGQRLMINYALVIAVCKDLEKLEFKSLIAIQRGHVIIDNVPKLCYTEKINWSRLTLRAGTNNIFLDPKAQCPGKATCLGCRRDSCWSNDVCQKLENDSVLSLTQDTKTCHAQCLGGCYNRTAQGCVVCKTYTDHGTCVEKCPSDKYTCSHYLRCYTRDECVNKKHLYILKKTCVDFCPGGYVLNNSTYECEPCENENKCLKICKAKYSSGDIFITDIKNAESLRGCQILDGNVIVNVHQFIDQRELVESLKDVKEITGYLNVNRAIYLTSLNFFDNLEKIHGQNLESNIYSLIIYNNKNLTEFWNIKSGLEILNGGMYIHGNDKLCNRRIRAFRDNTKHDRNLDSFQKSDQEVLCSPAKISILLQVINQNSMKVMWRKDDSAEEVEIIYRPLMDRETLYEKSELDTEICDRIKWNRELILIRELKAKSSFYEHMLRNLKPNTKYAVLLKSFGGNDDRKEARSEIYYPKTQFDIPKPPKIIIESKTHNEIRIEIYNDQLSPPGSQVVDYYTLKVYKISDDKELLDKRNYCEEPAMSYKDKFGEDYDECCTRREKEDHDKVFFTWLKEEYSCGLDKTEYCVEKDSTEEHVPYKIHRFEAWQNKFVISYLQQFHLYVLQAKACNHYGCSSYSMLSTRTNYSVEADKVNDFSACKFPGANVYNISFSEPENPNGYITSYAVHFRYQPPVSGTPIHELNKLVCITRSAHQRNNYVYKAHLDYTFNQVALRIHSLGYHTFMDWSDIPICQTTIRKASSRNWTIHIISLVCGTFGLILVWYCYKSFKYATRPVRPPTNATNASLLTRTLAWLGFRRRSSGEEGEPLTIYANQEDPQSIQLQPLSQSRVTSI